MAVQTEAEGEVGIVPLVDFANSAVETWDRWLDGGETRLVTWLAVQFEVPTKKKHRIWLFFRPNLTLLLVSSFKLRMLSKK